MDPVNRKNLSGVMLEKALAAKLQELLRGVDRLRGWQVEHVGGASDAGFDLLAAIPPQRPKGAPINQPSGWTASSGPTLGN